MATPDFAVPPGDILAEILSERGIAIADFARDCGLPVEVVEGVLDGRREILDDDSKAMGAALGIEATFLSNLQAAHRTATGRRRAV